MYRQLYRLVQARRPKLAQSASYSASPLGGRAFLPGSEATTFPKFLPNAIHDFPYVFKARTVTRDDLVKFGQNFRPLLDRLLQQYGAVIIRGAAIDNAQSFSDFFLSLDFRPMRNVPGLGERRPEEAKNVYGGRPDPPALNIEPHHELSYMTDFPHLFFVHCEQPVAKGCGGDYILVDVRDIQRQLDPDVFNKFKSLGIRYYRQLPCDHTDEIPSWRTVMGTYQRDVVQSRLQRHGYSIEWDQDGTLHYWITLPAVRRHYHTGEELWFNQAHSQHWTFLKNHPSFHSLDMRESQFPSNTFYGDGTPIEIDVIQHIREVTWRNAYGVRLGRGDLLVIDNMYIQHGRLAYQGKRKVSIALAKYLTTQTPFD